MALLFQQVRVVSEFGAPLNPESILDVCRNSSRRASKETETILFPPNNASIKY